MVLDYIDQRHNVPASLSGGVDGKLQFWYIKLTLHYVETYQSGVSAGTPKHGHPA